MCFRTESVATHRTPRSYAVNRISLAVVFLIGAMIRLATGAT